MWFQLASHVVISVLTVAAVLSLAAVLLGWLTRRRRPALEHACWVVVLLRLIIPPFVPWTVPGFPVWPKDPSNPNAVTSLDQSEAALPSSSPAVSMPPSSIADVDLLVLEQAERFLATSKDGSERSSDVDQAPNNGEEFQVAEPLTIDGDWEETGESPATAIADRAIRDDRPANAIPIAATSHQPGHRSAEVVSSSDSAAMIGKWTIAFAMMWVLGSLIVAVRSFHSMWQFRCLLRLSQPPSPEVLSSAESVKEQVGLQTTPAIWMLAARIPPMVWSRFGRAIVVLPSEFEAVHQPVQRELLLAHEFVHLHRRDHLVRWLELVATILWWWCPLYWVARSRLRLAEESACDARVLRLWPDRAGDYGKMIVDTVGFMSDTKFSPHLATGGLGSIRTLQSRLRSVHTGGVLPGNNAIAAAAVVLLATISCPLMLVGEGMEDTATRPQQISSTSDNESGGEPTDLPKKVLTQVSTDRPEGMKDLLPPQCDPTYAVHSPDKKKIAFVGSATKPDGTKQHGLFCHDTSTNELTCLIEKGLRTAPAWSPDSQKIAIGNSPGYGNIYPLVIVDVVSAEIDQTGAQGAGAAWSPDGRYVAVSTGFHHGGSWAAGVPCDGRIGLWDTIDRKITYVSPPGVNRSDRSGRVSFMTGALRPTWSPNGKWIAWRQTISNRTGEKRETRSEVWVATKNGDSLKRVFDQGDSVRWSDDSTSLIQQPSGQVVVVDHSAAEDDQTSFPSMPAELSRLLEKEREAAERATGFDAKSVLDANRLWQNPTLEGIDSIGFVHRMSPKRLDESFVWRADGTSAIEVKFRDDGAKRYGQGWSVIYAADGSSYTFSDRDGLPRYRSAEQIAEAGDSSRRARLSAAEILRRDTLRRLSGTRLNFAAIDWGRRPDDFLVTDVKREGSNRIVQLQAKSGKRSLLNVGAMFETTSWAYVHDVRIERSLLTINADGQIVREVSHSGGKVVADIQLTDWVSRGGQQAPTRIVFDIPNSDFRVDQRFRVTDEGFWILSSGTSKFAEHEPQKEEIVDLRINASTDHLSKQLDEAKNRVQQMDVPPEQTQAISIRGLTPLELGMTCDFDSLSEESANAKFLPKSLTWMPTDRSSQQSHTWLPASLCAELRFPPSAARALGEDSRLMLAVYDQNKLPLYTTTIAASAVDASNRRTESVLGPLLEKHQLWLRDAAAPLPNAQYRLRFADREEEATIPNENRNITRGITLSLALDAYRAAPDRWRMPLAFTAQWNGRPVKVLGLVGPGFKQVFGSGLSGTYVGGYTSTQRSSVLLVVDAETGFPLVERSESMEFRFLDYVEAAPGQFAPLRVLCKTESMNMDLRFQLLDGRLWLFDRRVQSEDGATASVDLVTIDGRQPQTRLQSDEPDSDGAVSWFDWGELVSRKPEQSGDHFSASLASAVEPWRHPGWKMIEGLSVETENEQIQVVRCNLRPRPSLGAAKYWTLTHISEERARPLTCPQTVQGAGADSTVVVVPLAFDQQIAAATMPGKEDKKASSWNASGSASNKTRVRQFQVQRDDGRDATLRPEILSTSWYTDQLVRVTAVLIDDDGVVVAGGFGSDSFRTYSEPVLSSNANVSLTNSDRTTSKHVLIAWRSLVTGAPMGSRWGSFWNNDPPFNHAELLASRFSPVRQQGLRDLYRDKWSDVHRRFERLKRGRDDRRVLEQLYVYRNQLAEILTGENGDSDESLAIACRLAGFSANRDFADSLRQLLKHESPLVRDSATIGLGLLGEKGAVSRLEELSSQSPPDSDATPLQSHQSVEVEWALKKLNG